MSAVPITFLSDYGYEDEFAGVCRAVISAVAPGVQVIDLTHGVARHDIRGGAATLARALPYTPPGVHLAVVDPGVGTERRPIAVRVEADDRILVGPDNGLLAPAIRRLGGVVEAANLRDSSVALERVYKTFHGRDIFAPVAAHLALGHPLDAVGDPISPDSISMPAGLAPTVEGERIAAHVVHVDQYGNIALDVVAAELAGHPVLEAGRVRIAIGGRTATAMRGETFSDVPVETMVIYEDSSGSLSVAINRGNMAEAISVKAGDEIVMTPSEAL